jgi:presenilin-like A22 family membrane protease
VAVRLFSAVLAVIRNVLGWAVLGTLLGAAVAYYENTDILWFAMFGAMVGGGIGLLFGVIRALRIVLAPPRRER